MSERRPPELDMLPDGTFRQPARPPIMTRVFFWASVVAVIAGGFAIAAFLLWISLILIPIALLAGVIAWLAFRFQIWRAQGFASRKRDLWRP